MINVVFVMLTKEAFSDVIQGVNSKHFLLAPLSCSTPSFCWNNYRLIAYNIYDTTHTLGRQLAFFAAEVLAICVLLHEMLLATSARISQAANVRTIRKTSKFQQPTSLLINTHLLILSLMVTSRYSNPKPFPLSDDTVKYSKRDIWQ